MNRQNFGVARSEVKTHVSLANTLSQTFTTQTTVPKGIAVNRSTAAHVWGDDGTLVEVPANAPRLGHDPETGAPLGLLIENASTNLLAHSVASTAHWSTGATSPSDLSLNALGRFPGVRVPSSGVVWSRLLQAFPGTSGQAYAITLYYQAGTSPDIRLTISGGNGASRLSGSPGAVSQTQASIGSFSGISERILFDGQTREIRAVFTATTTETLRLGFGPESTTVDEDVILLAAQVEEGASFSSYIHSDGTAGTRSADAVTVTTLRGAYQVTLDYADGQTQDLGLLTLSSGTEMSGLSSGHIARIKAVQP